MYLPSRTTRVFTGKVRPHKYLYRILKPGGYYEYVYLEDLLDKESEGEVDSLENMLRIFFIRVCKKIFGVKGEVMATRFLNGQSITVTERQLIDKVIEVLESILPEKYIEAFKALIEEINARKI
ncbi:MAG: hypothetical protein GX918_10565 [Clostridiales bacterium]|nr:hypothetical protein [Clostridiales bacterium]